MNVFLCSTVRHLMFSVLKASKDLSVDSFIIVIMDQQKLNRQDFNVKCLPDNIKMIFINRGDMLSTSYRGVFGKLLKLLAVCNAKPTCYIKNITRKVVFEHYLNVALDESAKLYLFNDRNRLSRLFRLSFDYYSVIEDGLSNYSGIKFSLFDKISNTFIGNQNTYRYIGDNERCENILLLNPDKAPFEISSKVSKIDFVDNETVIQYCQPLFHMNEKVDDNITCVLATQPISIGRLTESNYDIDIYCNIIKYLKNKNINVALKVHPRESEARYKKFFPDVSIIAGKVPLEVVIFSLKKKPDILSIYSTAGLGFEQFCMRKTLIHEEEVLHMDGVFELWRKDISLVSRRLEELL